MLMSMTTMHKNETEYTSKKTEIIATHIEQKNTPQMKVKNHNTDSTKYPNRKM